MHILMIPGALNPCKQDLIKMKNFKSEVKMRNENDGDD